MCHVPRLQLTGPAVGQAAQEVVFGLEDVIVDGTLFCEHPMLILRLGAQEAGLVVARPNRIDRAAGSGYSRGSAVSGYGLSVAAIFFPALCKDLSCRFLLSLVCMVEPELGQEHQWRMIAAITFVVYATLGFPSVSHCPV